MNVSSYLEAFLTMYGWEFYYILFLLLMLTGLFLYPLLRNFCAIYIDYLGNPERKNDSHLYEMLTTLGLGMLIFFMALVPMVPADLNQVRIKGVCQQKQETVGVDVSKISYFRETKTRIPVMPWLAIMLGQGVNSVIYKTSPCTIDITEAQKAVWNSDLDADGELQEEYRRFRSECHNRAVELVRYWRSGVNKATDDRNQTQQDVINRLIKQTYKENSTLWHRIWNREPTERELDLMTQGLDSELFKKVFYNPDAIIHKELRASEKVAGYSGDDGNGNMSPNNPPTCGDWWLGQGGTPGLRTRLAASLSDRTVWRVVTGESGRNGPEVCIGERKTVPVKEGSAETKLIYIPTPEKMRSCKEEIVKQLYAGDEKQYTKQLLEFDQGNFAKDTVLTEQEKGSLRNAVTVAVGAALLSKFVDIDLAGGVLNTIVSFYASLYMLKLMLRHLLPMIMMTTYMFWGIYLVLGRMSMDAVIKGMILIICLNIIPGVWAVMEHLDDTLWQAMYGNDGTSSVLDTVLLDAASSAFFVASIGVIFYMVNMADGVNAGSTVKDSQASSQTLTRGMGNAAGSSAAAASGKVTAGARNLMAKAGRGIKGGLGKLFKK